MITYWEVVEPLLKKVVSIPIIDPLIKWLATIPIIQLLVTKPIFAVIICPGLAALGVALIFIIWFERKAAARVQWRFGPLEVSRRIGGLIQPIADLFRYLFQEVIIHREAYRLYFFHLPILVMVLVLLPIIFIPGGPDIYGLRSPYSLVIVIALSILISIAVIAIGWASSDRFAYIGVVREALMSVSYEIPLIISLTSMIITYGTADLVAIVEKQGFLLPGILLNPLAFLVFFISVIMATSRFPFEIPDAETEIVFGPFTEYSGILFGLAMTICYELLYVYSLLGAVVFLSGWWGPYIPPLGDLSYLIWTGVKTYILMMIAVFLRAVYPRYRIDQALRIGWRELLILSLISLFISLAVRYVLGGW